MVGNPSGRNFCYFARYRMQFAIPGNTRQFSLATCALGWNCAAGTRHRVSAFQDD